MARIRLLEVGDMAGAMALKEAAGWNQTSADWERLLELEREGCFVMEEEGEVAATATAVTYGCELAWIGMVLTLPRFRGRGFARALMERAVAYAESRGVAKIGLDATAMGIGLYRQLGFVAEGPIERRRLERAEDAGEELGRWEDDTAAERVALLRSLAQVESAAIPGAGYAMGRPGSMAAYFGPCVSNSREAAGRLLRWFLGRHRGEAVYWDILAANGVAVELAAGHGFERVRELTRMSRVLRQGGDAADVTRTFAIAGFEWG